jgi:hypothetical protein
MIDYNGIELRIRAKSSDPETKRTARAELRRRIGNLRGGVIPAWEKQLRGDDPSKWAVV